MEMNKKTSPERERSPSPPRSVGDSILFFGYGPIVHEMVRSRRNIRTTELQPAFLDGYRLSFEFGGVANIVRQRGYRVHGVMMTLQSLRDWKKLQSYDIQRRVTQKMVFHYPKGGFNYDEDDDDEEKEELVSEIAYMIGFPDDVQDTLLHEDPALERLPQEGYLKILSDGMQQNGISHEYIEDEILNVPFIPDRCTDDYSKFPIAHTVGKISYSTYLTLCQKAKVEGDLYFVLGDFVFRLGEHDPSNPLAAWIEEHGHGKGDVTYCIQLIFMDTSISFCERKSDVTPSHVCWAENQLVAYIQQHGLTATKVFQFCNTKEEEQFSSSMFGRTEEFSARPSNINIPVVNMTPESPTRPRVHVKKGKVLSVFFKRMVQRNR